MLPPARLPQIGPVTIPAPGPAQGRCPDKVRETDGDLLAVDDSPVSAAVSGRELFDRSNDVLRRAFFPQEGAAAPPSEEVQWAVRVNFQLMLLFFGVRQSYAMLEHTPNAATDLMPAVDCALRFSDVITAQDPRVKSSVDFSVVAQQRQALAGLRELLRLGQAFCKHVDAGARHTEQYLDSVARFVYKRLQDSLGEDYLMQGDMEPLVNLVASPIDAAKESLRKNAQLSAEAEERGASRVRAELEGAQPPAQAPSVVVSAPVPPVTLGPRTGDSPPPVGRSKRRA